MSERPEKMLPEQRITARARLEEVRTDMAVKQQQNTGGGHTGAREEQQESRNEGHPGEEGHTVDGHAGRAQFEDGHYKVERTGDGRNAKHQDTQRPEVCIQTGCTGNSASAATGGQFVEWRVVEPAG